MYNVPDLKQVINHRANYQLITPQKRKPKAKKNLSTP
jgi:hypothetical protein